MRGCYGHSHAQINMLQVQGARIRELVQERDIIQDQLLTALVPVPPVQVLAQLVQELAVVQEAGLLAVDLPLVAEQQALVLIWDLAVEVERQDQELVAERVQVVDPEAAVVRQVVEPGLELEQDHNLVLVVEQELERNLGAEPVHLVVDLPMERDQDRNLVVVVELVQEQEQVAGLERVLQVEPVVTQTLVVIVLMTQDPAQELELELVRDQVEQVEVEQVRTKQIKQNLNQVQELELQPAPVAALQDQAVEPQARVREQILNLEYINFNKQ